MLRLLITVTDPVNNLSFASLGLDWTGTGAGDLAGANAVGCPSPENSFGLPSPGFGCTDGGAAVPPFVLPGPVGNPVIGAGTAGAFDLILTPPSTFTTIFLGAIEFTVGAGATAETVNVSYAPGVDSVNDGLGGVFFPGASATVIVPEPGTAGLMGLGLLALGMVGRRRN
ncbi:MAG: PEP-CTERM sorting domain-containing protein [Myxococcota bacterium]